MVGLSVFQPVVALASPPTAALAAERVAQGLTPARGQPGPIVRQAFDLLMDRFVVPPESGNVLNGGLDGAHHFLVSKNVEDPLAERPAFTGDRRADWRLFLPAYEKVSQALGTKAPREDLDRAMVDGMARSFKEQHTYYLPPELYSRQMAELQNQNQFAGIGVMMGPELTILDVFEDSPAEQAGVMVGDQILAVNGEAVEGLAPTETSSRIRGEAGTSLTLTLRRGNSTAPLVKQLTRAMVSVQWLRSKILDGGIGYLQIRQFAIPDALPIFDKAMKQFEEANIRALIIDVRTNPGGSVATGEEILSRLLPEARPLFRQVDRRNGERTAYTWGDSMSEILAAALQENGAAKVIGTKTAGAVAAAIPWPLADGSGLLVTVSTITTPSGRVLNEVGLEPDQVVELDPDQFRIGKDTQLEAALTYVRDEVGLRSRAPQDAR
jgi:carboxyl-terminal processing protease